jgi:hypothetical protein
MLFETFVKVFCTFGLDALELNELFLLTLELLDESADRNVDSRLRDLRLYSSLSELLGEDWNVFDRGLGDIFVDSRIPTSA